MYTVEVYFEVRLSDRLVANGGEQKLADARMTSGVNSTPVDYLGGCTSPLLSLVASHLTTAQQRFYRGLRVTIRSLLAVCQHSVGQC